jgi:hypothetical protein
MKQTTTWTHKVSFDAFTSVNNMNNSDDNLGGGQDKAPNHQTSPKPTVGLKHPRLEQQNPQKHDEGVQAFGIGR